MKHVKKINEWSDYEVARKKESDIDIAGIAEEVYSSLLDGYNCDKKQATLVVKTLYNKYGGGSNDYDVFKNPSIEPVSSMGRRD